MPKQPRKPKGSGPKKPGPKKPGPKRPGRKPRPGATTAHRAAVAPPTEPGLAPHCRHFGTCGGCSQLDMPIDAQLEHKVGNLEQLLANYLDGVQIDWQRPRVVPTHYRTKLLYPVCPGGDGKPIVGIYRRRSHALVRIRECQTQDPGLTELGLSAERILRDLRLHAWDESTGKGFIRAFAARIAPGTGELLMGVVTRPGLFAEGAALADRLLEAAQDLPHSGRQTTTPVGVVRSITERDGNYLLGDRTVPLKGRDFHEDLVDGLVFRMRFGSFYQVHRDSNAVLYRPAMALAGDVRGARVVDGYGGVGTFGLRCMKQGAESVEIIEDNPVACGDATHNAKANGFANVRVQRARFAEVEIEPGADLMIVDPPRSGLAIDGVQRVLASRPKRLLCVHCSAESLARDLAALTQHGFRVRAVRLCDMFPHTDHVEVVTLLEPPRG